MLARPPSAASQCLFSVAARQPPPDPGTRTRKERKSRSPMWLPAERRCCGGCSALLGAALLVVLLSHQPSAPTRVLVEGGQTSVLTNYPFTRPTRFRPAPRNASLIDFSHQP